MPRPQLRGAVHSSNPTKNPGLPQPLPSGPRRHHIAEVVGSGIKTRTPVRRSQGAPSPAGSDCPRERFPTLAIAEDEVFARRARAALSGASVPDREAYPCDCGGAHIRRIAPATGDAA